MRGSFFFLIVFLFCLTPAVAESSFVETGPELERVLAAELPVFADDATLEVRVSASPDAGEPGEPAWKIRHLRAVWRGAQGTVAVEARGGRLVWQTAEALWRASLTDTRLDLAQYHPLQALGARIDLPLLAWLAWRGSLSVVMGAGRCELELDLQSPPYALQGKMSCLSPIAGELRLAWRERRLPLRAWLPRFLDAVFEQRELQVRFRREGFLRFHLPVEDRIRRFFYAHRRGDFRTWPRRPARQSLNPVLRAAVTVLEHQSQVFADPGHYFLNLINLELPHALAVLKNLPLNDGRFRDYHDFDLDTFLAQFVYEQLGQHYLIDYENYRLKVPPTVKERLEFDLYEEIRPDELAGLTAEERFPLLILVHGQLRQRRLTAGDGKIRALIRALLVDLTVLADEAGSWRVSGSLAAPMNRSFRLALALAVLLEHFDADGVLKSPELAGSRLLLDQLIRRVRRADLDPLGRRLLFALERGDCGPWLSRIRDRLAPSNPFP